MLQPTAEQCYAALCARDVEFDGLFFACVRTTGIFCRPTCRARKPRPENVEYTATVAEALRAGYRPCKICRPLATGGAHAPWAETLIQGVSAEPDRRVGDNELRARGFEPARVRRYFKQRFGVTFHAWQRAWRLGNAMTALRAGTRIDDLAAASGYASASAFREAFQRLFGAPPSAVDPEEALVADWIETALGPMLAVASQRGLALLEFVDRRGIEAQILVLRRRFARPVGLGSSAHIEQTRRELGEYFSGTREEFDVPLDLSGSPFEETVWRALREIPYGETRSYAELAAHVGRAGAARAVGRANGMNRIAILVPCHRVIGADGKLTGYAGGLARKHHLLALEQGRDPRV